MNEDRIDKFTSNFGFLMASIGSAVGLGNLWGFPYKMGMGGGFVFLLIYLLLVVAVGYPLMLSEIALGRKSRRGAIEAYRSIDPKSSFIGWFSCIAPFLLICFYVTFGGYVIKYLVANLGDLLHASFGVGGAKSTDYFNHFIQSGWSPVIYGWIFLGISIFIVVRGINNGIEKFSNFAMPALFVMLVIVVIRACTLPGAGKGLEFIFKPRFEVFQGKGWLSVLGSAGSQMFFSLSLSAGAIIAFGSYLDKGIDIEWNAFTIPFADTLAAVLATMAVMPAVFAYGLEPTGGPGLLFVSLQTVFSNMGATGPLFGTIFYLLVLFASVTSSIAMMEGAVACMLDGQERKGKKRNRKAMTLVMGLVALLGSALISADALGASGFWHPFGQDSWLNVFDLGAEGILMPLSGLCLSILVGWVHPHALDDEVLQGSSFKSRKFFYFCIRYICPIALAFIVLVQLNAFFHFI